MKSWLQRKFINLLVRHLFNTVGKNQILRAEGRKVYFMDRELSREQTLKLKSDAIAFKGSFLWQVLTTDSQYHANKQIYESSKGTADILFGKALLYLIDIQQQKLESLSQ